MKQKMRTQKGFTLAELLIVVAIIGVLVAISIPIFGPRLEGSREATDAANLRNAYAAATSAILVGKTDNNDALTQGSYTLIYKKDGTLLVNGAETEAMTGKSTSDGWQGTDLSQELPQGVTFNGNSERAPIYVRIDMDDNEVEVQFGAFS